MEKSHFFAVLSRMRYINRWGLMRNIRSENLEEHSLQVAVIAHALALIRNRRFKGNADAQRVALLAIFHDAQEIFTGDLPTPVKYHDEGLREAYRRVEEISLERILSYLPHDLRGDYESLLIAREEDAELWKLVRAADKLSALIKCIEEEKAGNSEFKKAAASLMRTLEKMELPEVKAFMEEFLLSFRLTIDELG
jgi:5'-deoxynucleotidase